MTKCKQKINWDKQPLGQMPDAALAEILGAGCSTVEAQRKRRKINSYTKKINWDKQPLGLVEDSELAKALNVMLLTVYNNREKRNIKAYQKTQRYKSDKKEKELRVKKRYDKMRSKMKKQEKQNYNFLDWENMPLGVMSDKKLADTIGVHYNIIKRHRMEFYIKPYQRYNWNEQNFGVDSDSYIAKEIGCSSSGVRFQRLKRGINAITKEKYWDDFKNNREELKRTYKLSLWQEN